MGEQINTRKTEHIQLSLNDSSVDRRQSGYDSIRLIHRALPELSLEEIDPSVTFLGKRLAFPLIISSMTGGDSTLMKTINQNLAVAAERCGIGLAVGSQRITYTAANAEPAFQLRQFAPTTLILSNLGAVQLNYGFDTAMCRKLVESIGADGLFLHLNPLQEAIQPEGDTDFSNLAAKIKTIQDALPFPVLVKEVGCGMSPADVERLAACGIRHIDLSGRGGTSWSRIESFRSDDNRELGLKFQDWGLTTVESLKLNKKFSEKINFIAGGGLRSGIDLAKSVLLGAKVGSCALPFLQAATESSDKVIDRINQLKKEFVTTMFLLGARNIQQLRDNADSYIV